MAYPSEPPEKAQALSRIRLAPSATTERSRRAFLLREVLDMLPDETSGSPRFTERNQGLLVCEIPRYLHERRINHGATVDACVPDESNGLREV